MKRMIKDLKNYYVVNGFSEKKARKKAIEYIEKEYSYLDYDININFGDLSCEFKKEQERII